MTATVPAHSRTEASSTGGVAEIDLHGVIRIRLVDATDHDRRAVERQFGPAGHPSPGPADITITYVDHLTRDVGERLLGAHEFAFTDDHFFVVRGRHKKPVRVRLPMESIGGACELVCEHGVGRVPLLVAIVNLTLGARGALAVHGSAFTLDGQGVLAMGWSKGGKTEALLAAMARGGAYVGDEWVHLHDHNQMSGIVEPMRIWNAHLRSLPELRGQVPALDRLRLGALSAVGRLEAVRVPALQRAAALASGRTFVDLAPERVVDASSPLTPRTASLDRVLLVTSAAGSGIDARSVSAAEVASRMGASLTAERSPLDAAYRAWQFAFPGRTNALVETADARERDALARFLSATGVTEVTEIRHPYPVDLVALGETIDEIVRVS